MYKLFFSFVKKNLGDPDGEPGKFSNVHRTQASVKFEIKISFG